MSESTPNASGNNRKRNISILLIIGAASLIIRLLISYEFDRSALLYVGVPFLVAVALLYVVEKPAKPGLTGYYGYLVLWSLIVMLGTSIVLFEGFVCVVMFMPIYFGILLLMYLFQVAIQKLESNNKGTHYVQVLPVLLFLSAFEGVVPSMTFEREYSVTRELLVDASIQNIQQQLAQPMELQVERNWLLSLFPMPTNIDAGTLSSGDVHQIDFVYHRWFVTNTHKGHMKLELTDVQPNYIRTTFLEDTSYIGNYLNLKGTEIGFETLDNGKTKIVLTIHYHRFLDPAWYFGPIQEYAIGHTAELLLAELFVPKTES
ncbi:hypothetical protein OAP14_11595 [Aliiglaciecola sp.]|nr:hypothetical protein [Aliiglaciecola sp.]